MANTLYDTYSAASKVAEDKTKAVPAKPRPLSEQELQQFGNFANTTDVKDMARYLGQKGLIGASQLINDTGTSVINSEADWKTAAFSQLLIQARRFGIKTPAEINANRDALMGTLDPRIKDALKNPVFAQNHPNYWETLGSVLKDQYAKELPAQPNP